MVDFLGVGVDFLKNFCSMRGVDDDLVLFFYIPVHDSELSEVPFAERICTNGLSGFNGLKA